MTRKIKCGWCGRISFLLGDSHQCLRCGNINELDSTKKYGSNGLVVGGITRWLETWDAGYGDRQEPGERVDYASADKEKQAADRDIDHS